MANSRLQDGVDQWPLLSGSNLTAPRTELYGDGLYDDGVWPAYLIQGPMKLLVGSVPFAVWTGPQNPNNRWTQCDALNAGAVDMVGLPSEGVLLYAGTGVKSFEPFFQWAA